jgi:hypothetical protein
MELRAIQEVLTEANFRPERDNRLKPNRLLILGGTPVDGTILTIHLDEGDVVIEDLAGKRGGICRIPLGDPCCFDKLIAAIRRIWKEITSMGP